MRCSITSADPDKLLSYCSGTLPAEDAISFERHTVECSVCRAEAQAQTAVWDAMSDWTTIPISADFNRRLFARVQVSRSRWNWFSWSALVPAAALTALASGLFLTQHSKQYPIALTVDSKVERVDVDQVERALDDLDMLKRIDGPSGAI